MGIKTIEADSLSLTDLLKKIKDGQEIVIMDHSVPVARVLPAGSRIPGLHLDAIKISEDFDAPLAILG